MKLVRTYDAFNIFKLLYILIIFTSAIALKSTLAFYNGYLLRTEIDIGYMLEAILYSLFLLTGGMFLFYKYT